jgi:hypothetical protein
MNDSHSDKRLLYAAIQEHFPYELDILEHGVCLPTQSRIVETRNSCNLLKNAVIEAFWLQARNIIEFLNHAKNKNGVLPRARVSAKDFTKSFEADTSCRTCAFASTMQLHIISTVDRHSRGKIGRL